ncbi:MAG: hypothetical protein HOP10_03700 [Chitinophagaceae bacterium]|nr:hypothetical protein [Chitinophagaceae bacterium]
MKENKYLLLFLLFSGILINNKVIAQDDSIVAEEIVKLKYYNSKNSMQFLILENYQRTRKKSEPLVNKKFQLYLDSIQPETLIAAITTNNTGKAKSFLPINLKNVWEASATHKFIAIAAGKEAEPAAAIEITKAKIHLDTTTSDGVRSITVTVSKYENGEWIPANEVEMKVGVLRLGGILPAGDEGTYTTDSSGTITVEVTKDSLPGDTNGNFLIAARVENNDQLGNLEVEQLVPWGVAVKTGKDFFSQRTLWSTRFKTPFWLLFMAYGIVLSVWGTLIYLIIQFFKIKKLGKIHTTR